MMTWNSLFFQSPSNFLMETVIQMHDYVMMFLSSIMIIIFMNFMNLIFLKKLSMEFFENHQLENIWTMAPFMILIAISIPSLNSLYMLDSCSFCGMTVIVTGHQWYWSYFMKNTNLMEFDSYMEKENKMNSILRLIDVDNRLVIPSNIPIRFLTTSTDVIHSWTIPSMGFKMDAIPGRVNQFCFSSKKSGIYFGQCSEICGSNHSFMPIVMESVNKIYWK